MLMLLLLPEFAVSQQGDARRDVRRLVEFAGDGWTLERKQERLHVGHAHAHQECARARYTCFAFVPSYELLLIAHFTPSTRCAKA